MPILKTFFKQACPVCGRPLFIPVDLLGKEASCSHCSGVFAADGQDATLQYGGGIWSDEQKQETKFWQRLGYHADSLHEHAGC
ncbi:hypothetical protein RBWH47_02942 [Rhodopirellula baltica WH47]|uniref:Transcription factor zinc-finger domain-containing protein n=1 Tax=Rhodopirellula baltica WH47 TaxID=991778 RepID=F2B145_RHOBT|nr:hypothetical protein RBWH47_02942 [Rhodopirellula baltica WH47]